MAGPKLDGRLTIAAHPHPPVQSDTMKTGLGTTTGSRSHSESLPVVPAAAPAAMRSSLLSSAGGLAGLAPGPGPTPAPVPVSLGALDPRGPLADVALPRGGELLTAEPPGPLPTCKGPYEHGARQDWQEMLQVSTRCT